MRARAVTAPNLDTNCPLEAADYSLDLVYRSRPVEDLGGSASEAVEQDFTMPPPAAWFDVHR
jgi:hypothetical protein